VALQQSNAKHYGQGCVRLLREAAMEQLDIYSLKEEAINRVESNADPGWMNAAAIAVKRVALKLDTFTTDDVWDELGYVSNTTHEPRAMGAVMRNAARAGIITATSGYRTSKRGECHGRPVRVWTSVKGAE
jgi:hypothetical protein